MAISLGLSTRRVTIIATARRLPRCARNDILKWVRVRPFPSSLIENRQRQHHGRTDEVFALHRNRGCRRRPADLQPGRTQPHQRQ